MKQQQAVGLALSEDQAHLALPTKRKQPSGPTMSTITLPLDTPEVLLKSIATHTTPNHQRIHVCLHQSHYHHHNQPIEKKLTYSQQEQFIQQALKQHYGDPADFHTAHTFFIRPDANWQITLYIIEKKTIQMWLSAAKQNNTTIANIQPTELCTSHWYRKMRYCLLISTTESLLRIDDKRHTLRTFLFPSLPTAATIQNAIEDTQPKKKHKTPIHIHVVNADPDWAKAINATLTPIQLKPVNPPSLNRARHLYLADILAWIQTQ